MNNTTFSHNLKSLEYAKAASSKIEKICEPFFSSFGFTIFAYIKVMSNGKMLHLSSNEKWTSNFFEKEFFNEDDCFHRIRDAVWKEGNKTFILSGNPHGKHCCSLYDFNIWNTYSIYKKRENYVEGWAFGTSKNRENMLDMYAKNPIILSIFSLFFSEKAFDFTSNAEERNLILTEKSLDKTTVAIDESIDQVLHTILPKRFPIKFQGKKITFSKREVEHLSLLSNGYSAKEIAKIFGISHRTVEGYVEKMKSKVQVHRKNELIRIYLDNFEHHEMIKIMKIIKKCSIQKENSKSIALNTAE